MRSPSRLAATLLSLAAGCGTWSNEDVRFLEALPTREDLRVEVPAGTAAVALAGGRLAAAAPLDCGLGGADAWIAARKTSTEINASVDWVIGLVDLVRRYPPTSRLPDGRIWGPFDDDKHPGREIRIVIMRAVPADPAAPVEHHYAFEAREKAGAAPFRPVLAGWFVGATAARGRGSLALYFETIWELGMADADTPRGEMDVAYDRSVEPRTVRLALLAPQPGSVPLQQFDYAYSGFQDGRGLFKYLFQKPAAGGGTDELTVSASFAADGAGRGFISLAAASGATGTFQQCWDAGACLTYVDDPTGYSCGGALPCLRGAADSCPPVAPPP